MLSSQSPTIVLKDGRVRLVTGSPGGRTIPNTMLWVVLNVLEFGLAPQAAVDAPRTHHPWFPDILMLEGESWPSPRGRALSQMGHAWKPIGHLGIANSIIVEPSSDRIHGLPELGRCSTAGPRQATERTPP